MASGVGKAKQTINISLGVQNFITSDGRLLCSYTVHKSAILSKKCCHSCLTRSVSALQLCVFTLYIFYTLYHLYNLQWLRIGILQFTFDLHWQIHFIFSIKSF